MLHDKINEVIPFISENFISYPLWEEGNYTPVVSFWKTFDSTKQSQSILYKIMEIINPESGYDYEIEYDEKIMTINISPVVIHTDEGGYYYQKKDWSIEEIIDLFKNILQCIKT